MQAVLANLGIGPAYTQADTLEDEVDEYLAEPQEEYVDIIEFWQVSRDELLC